MQKKESIRLLFLKTISKVRAGAGAHFHTPIVQGVKWEEVGILHIKIGVFIR